MKLKFTPIEDATLGFWLMAMDLRHVDHERFYTWAASCCFETLEHDKDREGNEGPTKVKVMDAVIDDLCTDDPWLVLHKIDSPTKMRALGDEARKCGPTPPLESIARAGGGQPWRPPGRSGGGGSGTSGTGDGGGTAAEVEGAVERGTGVGAGGSLSDEREEGRQQPEEEGSAAVAVADSAAAAADAAAAGAAAAVKDEAALAAAAKAAAAAADDAGGVGR